MTSARVFIHPRCLAGPAFGTLVATLEERNYDLAKLKVFSIANRPAELVRIIGNDKTGCTYERMSGSRFHHTTVKAELAQKYSCVGEAWMDLRKLAPRLIGEWTVREHGFA